MSDNKTLETKVWVESGLPGFNFDVLKAMALDGVRDQVPAAPLVDYVILDAKPTKRDGVAGTLYTLDLSYREQDGESTVSVDELIESMTSTPEFDPADHHDEA